MYMLLMSEMYWRKLNEVKFENFMFIKFQSVPKPLINYILVSFVMSRIDQQKVIMVVWEFAQDHREA